MRSVGVHPFHSACSSGGYIALQVPGLLTSSIPATVIPLKTSSESRRSRGGFGGVGFGTETGSGSFNAILRDYGRLGVLLANDGALGGQQIVPKGYLLEATDWRRQPHAFTPGKATPLSVGNQLWVCR